MRKTILLGSLAGAATLFVGTGIFAWAGFHQRTALPGAPGPREIELTYLARLPQLPRGAKEVHVWIPVAKTGVEQKILRREIRSPVPYSVGSDPEYGNDILHLTLSPAVRQPVEIAIGYRAVLLGNRKEASPDPSPAPDDLARYLQPEGLVIIDDEVRRRAREATAGRPSEWERARGIYDHVIRSMRYDKTTPGYGRGDTARACLVGAGNCTDFHSLFISMARAERIPSRFKIGFVVPPESSGTIPGYHCWAEVYAEGKGWSPLDASEASKQPQKAEYYFGARDPNSFLISTGREIQLVPAPRNGPVNILFYPYVEVDGRPFSGVETEFRFREVGREAET